MTDKTLIESDKYDFPLPSMRSVTSYEERYQIWAWLAAERIWYFDDASDNRDTAITFLDRARTNDITDRWTHYCLIDKKAKDWVIRPDEDIA
jgi:hypothetical protein